MLIYARKKGVNMSALGIGVDFLQVGTGPSVVLLAVCTAHRGVCLHAFSAASAMYACSSVSRRGHYGFPLCSACACDRIFAVDCCCALRFSKVRCSGWALRMRSRLAQCSSLVSACLTCLQIVSIFSSFGFEWPPQLTAIFSAASSSSFNQQVCPLPRAPL